MNCGMPGYDTRCPEEQQQTAVVEGGRRLTFMDATGCVQPGFLPRFIP